MMFLTMKEDVHVGGAMACHAAPGCNARPTPLMYQHLLLTLFIMVLCTPGSLGSTNRVAVQEQGINRCNRVNTCWECIKKPSCAWCTDGTEDGTCIFESERMLMCDDMKDSYIEKGYGCPNSVLDGGSAGPKREHGFGTSNRTENLKTFLLRTKNVHEVTAKSAARDALLSGINNANNNKIKEAHDSLLKQLSEAARL